MRTLRIAIFVAVSLVSLCIVAQGLNRRYDGFGEGYAQGSYGLERADSGNVIFSFSYEPDTITPDSILGSYRYVFTFLDEAGDVVAERRFIHDGHSTFLGWADCCDSIPGGGFVIGGGSKTYGTNVDESRLVCFSAQGDSLWSRTFGSPGAFWIGQQVKHTSDGGFVICGVTDSSGSEDAFVIKTDGQGNELWRATYSVPGSVVDGLTSIAESIDGVLYMSGSTFPNTEDNQHWFLKTNNTGSIVWEVQWGGPYKEGANYVLLTSEGRVMVAGGSGYAPDDRKPYLAELDTTDGTLLWEQEYGAVYYSTLFFAAKECPNTDIIACGVTYEGGNEQGLLLRATSVGDSLWMRNYSYYDEVIDSCRGRFWDVLPTDDGGFIMSGFANGPFNGPYPPGYSQDAWVVKVDSMGCVVPGCDGVGVTEIITNMQGALTVFPSPAHGQVQVQIDLPITMRNKQDLQLSLMNATGQLVAQQAAFEGNNTISLSTFAAGLYHVHLTNGRTWLAGTKLVVE